MTAGRWQQVKAIFDQAMACERVSRAEFVRERCGADEEVRREVDALLASDVVATSRLDLPFMGAGVMAAATPGADPMLGRTIGNYIITGKLGQSGMGVVYRARHVTLPRDVVVKCIWPAAFSEELQTELRTRFRREAHIQSQLDHPHIVRVYEFFTGAEEYFLVMEYVPGSSLRSVLDKTGALGEPRVRKRMGGAKGGLRVHRWCGRTTGLAESTSQSRVRRRRYSRWRTRSTLAIDCSGWL